VLANRFKMKKLDCTKITTIEEIALILENLVISIGEDCKDYDKLKHLLVDEDLMFANPQ